MFHKPKFDRYPVHQLNSISEEGPEGAEEQSASPVPATKSYRDLVFRRIISDLVPAEAISALKFYITIALEAVSTLPVSASDQDLFFQALTSNTVLDSDSAVASKLDEIISSTVPDSEFYRALVLEVIASDPASTPHGSTRDIVLKTLGSNTSPAADYAVDLVLDSITSNNYAHVDDDFKATVPLSNYFYVRALMKAAAELYDFLPKKESTEKQPAQVLPTSTSASSASQTTTTNSTPEPQLVEAKLPQVTSTTTATTTSSPSPSSPQIPPSPLTVIDGDGTRSPKSPLSDGSSDRSSTNTVVLSSPPPEPKAAPVLVSAITKPRNPFALSSKATVFVPRQSAPTQEPGSNAAWLALQNLRGPSK